MKTGSPLRDIAHRAASRLLASLLVGTLGAFVAVEPALAHDPAADPSADSGKASLAEVGAKLSNPVSDVWALFTEFDLTFSDGDVNQGDSKVGGRMLFQPVLPIPLFGRDEDAWRLIVRPAVPVLFGAPVPKGFDDFNNLTGLGDTALPLLVVPPTGDWLLGFGPTFLFPTATQNKFASDQWSMGPAAVLGYKTKDWVAGVFPQWYFGFASAGQGSKPNVNQLSLLYFGFYNLPNAWQVGFNPTATYNRRASGSNHWNVPIGLTVAKTTKIGSAPVKFQFGLEYSVVNQDDFGQRFQVKLNVIPVIQSLVKNPLFGGG